MAEGATKHEIGGRGGLVHGFMGVIEEMEIGGAAGPARVLFDLAERLIILTGVAFAEHRAPLAARAGLFGLKMILTTAFVAWIVQPLARRVNLRGREFGAEVHPWVRRLQTLVHILIVIALALLVSRALNYFLSYLAPKEEITGA